MSKRELTVRDIEQRIAATEEMIAGLEAELLEQQAYLSELWHEKETRLGDAVLDRPFGRADNLP